MDKIKSLIYKKSIKKDFAIYILLYILLSLIISLFCAGLCKFGQHQINERYMAEFNNNEKFIEKNFNSSNDEEFKIKYYTEDDFTVLFEPFDNLIYNILQFCSVAVYPVIFIICIGITSIFFYRRKIQKPLEILSSAAENISNNNLDFKIIYDRNDELGKLCLSFEKMRCQLWNNNIEMWRQIEERKRLNAAFSHDLRTPLTILKGQSEMLTNYSSIMSNEKITETAEMMKSHITRLENYVNTMNDLQRLEDIEIQRKDIYVYEMVRQMRETGASVCKNKKFILNDVRINNEKKEADLSIVMQVYENLLTNAVRFAHSMVNVSVYNKDNYLCVIVSDDGNGFSEKDLTEATRPFYKSAEEISNKHLGMGLNICKVLCEKHGGYLKLENNDGAYVTAAFR